MGKMTLKSIITVTINYVFLFFYKVENRVIIHSFHIDNIGEELP